MTSNISNDEDRKSYEKVGLVYNAIIDNKKEIFVKKLLQTEGDINYKISEGSRKVPNLLHTALDTDNGYFNLLLEHGADFTYQNEKSKTVVYPAINNLHVSEAQSSNLDLVLDAHVKFNNPSNPSDKNGMTHFHAACIKNNSSTAEFFLKNGVDVNLSINMNSPRFPFYKPLHLAVKHICPDVVEKLLEHGANIHLKNAAGLSPLHMIFKRMIDDLGVDDEDEAKFTKMLGIFAKFVINDEATNINDADDYGFCRFHIACIIQDEKLIENNIKKIENINRPVNFNSPVCPGYTALHFAAFSNVYVFKLLLRNGADIEAKNAKGETPFDLCLLHFANRDILSIILTKAEWKNIVLSDNKTTLVDVVSALENMDKLDSFLNENESALDLVVSFDSPLWPGYTLLHLAVTFTKGPKISWNWKEHDVAKINACLKRGADVTIKDAKGSTPLHLAFYMNKRYMAEHLLDHHDEVDNPADENNLSYFHIACALDKEKVIERLLLNGANVNSAICPIDSTFEYRVFNGKYDRRFYICRGSTALHIIAACGNKELVEILLRYGADVNIQDTNGFTPIHRCLMRSSDADKSMFLAKNLKNITAPCGLNHLHVASHKGNIGAVYDLLELGADINATVTYEGDMSTSNSYKIWHSKFDPYGDPRKPFAFLSKYAGYTPLHFTCDSCTIYTRGVVYALITKNANLYAKNDKGILPLPTWIRRFDHREIYFEVIRKCNVLRKYLEEEYGITMLHVACRYSELKLVKSLLKSGANANAKVNSKAPLWQGYTPLHCVIKKACEKYYATLCIETFEKIVRLLVKHGADVFLTDDHNNNPIHFIKYLDCHSHGSKYRVSAISPLLAVLLGKIENFNVNPVNNQGLSVFHVACLTANVAIIEKYLKHDVDVNQAISYFSNICPGGTPLHIIIQIYRDLNEGPSQCDFREKDFLQVVDMLLENGANVNATDASRNTPLHEALQLSGSLRQVLIKKFISNGADLHITNVLGNTAFEDFLSIGDTTWNEIEVFLNAGAKFNTCNPISQKGYLAIFLNYHQGIQSTRTIMDNRLLLRIFDNPNIIEISDSGRTAIHNVVSTKWKKESRNSKSLMKTFRRAVDIGFEKISWKKTLETNHSFYAEIIEQLLIRGCDIDHQDNEGKTALHLAVTFRNNKAIRELVKNGADADITDKNGKTAFAYCREPTESGARHWADIKDIDEDKNYANKIFASLVYKMEYCKQPVNEQNKQLQIKVFEKIGQISGKSLDCFHDEIEKTKSMKIGKTSISLYEFLTNEDTSTFYMNITNDERLEVDGFIENIGKYNFREIDCLVKLKYRRTIERKKLIEPAMNSLNILANYHLPDLISWIVFRFLTNEDLKRLIASVD